MADPAPKPVALPEIRLEEGPTAYPPDPVDGATREALQRCRNALGHASEPSVGELDFDCAFRAPYGVTVTFLVRCLNRVAPLAVSHPRLGLPILWTLGCVADACRSRPLLKLSQCRRIWHLLADELDTSLTRPDGRPLDPWVGHAALVAAVLMEAIVAPPPMPGALCLQAALDAANAVRESGTDESYSADMDRLAVALDRDLDEVVRVQPQTGPFDPSEAGRFGRLWPQAAPLFPKLPCPEAARAAVELTTAWDSSILADMVEVGRAQDQRSEARLPDVALDPSEARQMLETLRAEVTEYQAANVRRLRSIVSALAGNPFATPDENKQFARLVQDLANDLDVRLVCPQCQKPGTLQFESGSFRMNHRTTSHSEGVDLSTIRFVSNSAVE